MQLTRPGHDNRNTSRNLEGHRHGLGTGYPWLLLHVFKYKILSQKQKIFLHTLSLVGSNVTENWKYHIVPKFCPAGVVTTTERISLKLVIWIRIANFN
jgi:hypothetical protein